MVATVAGIGLGLRSAWAQDEERELIQLGRDVYGAQCATCHAAEGRGMPERGVPPLQGVGRAAVDFYVRTGRMPLPGIEAPSVHGPQQLTDRERRALMAYIPTFPGEPGPDVPDVDGWQRADITRGLELFASNCAACHGPTGAGIAIGGEDIAPSLHRATPLEIAEAIRIGPGVMPVFGPELYTEQDMEAVVRWVIDLRDRRSPGGLQLGRSGPVTEGLIAWVLGMGSLGVIMYLLGEKTGADHDSG